MNASLALRVCGLEFASPIVLLSGCVGFGDEYTRVAGFSNRDVGAVCLAGTTPEARLGGRPRRVLETPMGVLSATGLQNPGAEHVAGIIVPQLPFEETRFFANVWGATPEEYAAQVRRFDASRIDGIELNLDGHADIAPIVEACRKITKKPLIAKLSAGGDVREAARRCIEAGADALALINTVNGMAIDARTRTAVLGDREGGVSGPAIKPIALLKVHQAWQVAKPHRVPVIGQGGIASARDAIEFLIAGATCIGLGTGLFYDPLLCRKVNGGIADYLAAEGFRNVAELTGSLH